MNQFERSFKLRSPLLMALVAVTLVAGCGGGGGDFDAAAAANAAAAAAGAAAGPAGPAPALGSAAAFGSFGGNAGMTNHGLLTVITGAQGQPISLGTTGASTLITGFHDSAGCNYSETPLDVGAVNGTINTAAPPPTGTSLPICATTEGNAATKAIADAGALAAVAAYNDLAGRPGGIDLGNGELGGRTLAPGVYKSAPGSYTISLSDLTLDAGGNADAVWVFQMASTLTVGIAGPTGARSVTLINGAQPKNIFWQVGSAATINAAGGGTMVGTIISSAGTSFSTIGNNAVNQIVTLNGRALALNAAVTLVNTHINVPAP